jgi:hypothetical protein
MTNSRYRSLSLAVVIAVGVAALLALQFLAPFAFGAQKPDAAPRVAKPTVVLVSSWTTGTR